jgi:N-acetylmuramoyl-L-alanine amidase
VSRRALAASLLGGLLIALAFAASGPAAPELPARLVPGHSVKGRQIKAVRIGDPAAERVGLVVGLIHGDERAGLRVTRRLRRRYAGLRGAQIWVVHTVNPDGQRAGTRKNAHRVDLNRNFSYRWSGAEPPSSGYYAGPEPFSEPETRAVRRLVKRIRPDLSVWYHQPWGAVVACHGKPRIAYRYAKLARMATTCQGKGLPGTAVSWQTHAFPGSSAFVVEFGSGRPSGRAIRRNARAAVAVIRDGPLRASGGAGAAARRPGIRKWLIPYPKRRKGEMAAYSKRHYGKREWRLLHPKVLVEHISVTRTTRQVWETFAPDRPDPEFGELPGVCSHFVVSKKGRVFKLVPVSIRCRHTVGLNHVAIGIEHVGYRDGDVLGNKRQLRHSLKLTQWIRCRFEIKLKNVIGHNESLSSPFYRELDPGFRGQTHADWSHRHMKTYRRKLRNRGPC